MSEFQDPRRSRDALTGAEDQPLVAGTARRASPFLIAGAFAALAIALFLFLNGRRTAQSDAVVTPSATEISASAAPPPLDLPPATPPPAPVVVAPLPAPVVAAPVAGPAPPDDTTQRLHAPSVVVDLQSGRAAAIPLVAAAGATAAPHTGPTGAPGAGLAPPETAEPTLAAGGIGAAAGALAGGAAGSSPLLNGASGAGGLSPNEQFAARASEPPPDAAIATQMTNLDTIVTQGATIPAVLETAINSDLPGFTRAIVSRDVQGFDGKKVLIPRGSRVIGQYRNALSLGQSRVFIIWTRLIRPDGVTVQIGSPGDDALGRGGLTGDVNTHFFGRFGGAILLSVLSAGTAAIAGTPSTQITIGSPAAAAGAAASASVPTTTDILPTIKVKQGAAITIFVARDLDFSGVQSVK